MSFIQLSAVIKPEAGDMVSDALIAEACLAVTMDAADNEEVFQVDPQEQPLWQHTAIHALFPEQWDITTTIANLNQQFPNIEWQLANIADQDWVRITQQNFPAQHIAHKLWVIANWEKPENFAGNKIRINPGLAFGTGTHPTTQLCLEFLANNPPANKTVIDYGCGSGVLAIAAIELGAKAVHAIDHDPQALEAAHNNAELNNITPDKLKISNSSAEIKSAELVVANILANPLKQLASRITSLCEQDLILSGLLSDECDDIMQHYAAKLKFVKKYTRDGWALLHFCKT